MIRHIIHNVMHGKIAASCPNCATESALVSVSFSDTPYDQLHLVGIQRYSGAVSIGLSTSPACISGTGNTFRKLTRNGLFGIGCFPSALCTPDSISVRVGKLLRSGLTSLPHLFYCFGSVRLARLVADYKGGPSLACVAERLHSFTASAFTERRISSFDLARGLSAKILMAIGKSCIGVLAPVPCGCIPAPTRALWSGPFLGASCT